MPEQPTPPQEPAYFRGSAKSKKYPAMSQLLAIQRDLATVSLNPLTEPKDKASCARAWKELETLRRVILGKPVTTEPAKVKTPKARKMGNIVPLPEGHPHEDHTAVNAISRPGAEPQQQSS